MRQRKRKFMLMICTAVFSVTACSSSNSFSDPIDNPEITPKPIPAEGSAKTFTTTADGLYSLAEGAATLYNGASLASLLDNDSN